MPFGGYMSLVIYKDGVLVGDTRGFRHVAAFDMIRDLKKVYKSKCGRIALGITGQALTNEDLQTAFEFFLNALTDHHYRQFDLDYNGNFTDEECTRLGMEQRHFLVMTKSHIFTVENGKLTDISQEPWYCSGNGVILADVFLTAGLSPQKTIEAVAKLTPEISSRFNIIQQHSLKPLITEVSA
jgi:hypothetical protein